MSVDATPCPVFLTSDKGRLSEARTGESGMADPRTERVLFSRLWRWSFIGFVITASVTWASGLAGPWTSAEMIAANIGEIFGGGVVGAFVGGVAAFLRQKR